MDKHLPKCEVNPFIFFALISGRNGWISCHERKAFTFYVSVGKFKEIKQKREVDMQTVIGNAGGYVGLFLGNIMIVQFSFGAN